MAERWLGGFGMVAYQSTCKPSSPPRPGTGLRLLRRGVEHSPAVSLALGGVIGEVADVRAVYVGAGLLLVAAAAVGLTTTLQPQRSPSRGAPSPLDGALMRW